MVGDVPWVCLLGKSEAVILFKKCFVDNGKTAVIYELCVCLNGDVVL